jgi:uncharacterized protein (DUF427 family)
MTTDQTQAGTSGPGYTKYPDHKVSLEPFNGRVRVMAGEIVLVESQDAILLTETGYSPVYYLPHSDLWLELLESVGLSTHCPFNGGARYWRLVGGRPAPLVAGAKGDIYWAC